MSTGLTRMVPNQPERLGIVRELYEVSAEYTASVNRLRTNGVAEEHISQDFYVAAIRSYADALVASDRAGIPADVKVREACIGLATIALRYARKVRLS